MKKLFVLAFAATMFVACKERNQVQPPVPPTPVTPQLAAPSNLKWDNSLAQWDAVPNANAYFVTLYKDSNKEKEVTATETEYSFVAEMTVGEKYKFSVQALSNATTYRSSAAVFSAETTAVAPIPPTAIREVIWNADYSVTFKTDQPASGATYSFGIFRVIDGDSDPDGYVSGAANYLGSLTYNGNSATISKERVKAFLSSIPESTDCYVGVWINGKLAETKKISTPPRLITVQRLDKPTNLRWEGTVAKWDASPNANKYFLWFYENGTHKKADATTNTQYDFGSSMSAGKTYQFNIKAIDTNSAYSESEIANGPEMTAP